MDGCGTGDVCGLVKMGLLVYSVGSSERKLSAMVFFRIAEVKFDADSLRLTVQGVQVIFDGSLPSQGVR